jgi:organic hydroperoxide reductase OsmC/OhrA
MIELVWDNDRSGTCVSSDGACLTAGDLAAWSPDDLLAMAAASCLMRTFLRMAAEEHVPVLGYVASAGTTTSENSVAVHVEGCVVVDGDCDQQRAYDLLQRAKGTSVVGRTLGNRLTVHAAVRGLRDLCHQGT